MTECRVCDSTGWVCEDHRDVPWDGISDSDISCRCGGAGAPRGACNLEMASAGYVWEALQKHGIGVREHNEALAR